MIRIAILHCTVAMIYPILLFLCSFNMVFSLRAPYNLRNQKILLLVSCNVYVSTLLLPRYHLFQFANLQTPIYGINSLDTSINDLLLKCIVMQRVFHKFPFLLKFINALYAFLPNFIVHLVVKKIHIMPLNVIKVYQLILASLCNNLPILIDSINSKVSMVRHVIV